MPSAFQLNNTPATAASAAWLLIYGRGVRHNGLGSTLTLPIPPGEEGIPYREEMAIFWFLSQTGTTAKGGRVYRELALKTSLLRGENLGLPITVKLSVIRGILKSEVIPDPQTNQQMTN
jgi:hypothetical protein